MTADAVAAAPSVVYRMAAQATIASSTAINAIKARWRVIPLPPA
jgi:hypothetical protein